MAEIDDLIKVQSQGALTPEQAQRFRDISVGYQGQGVTAPAQGTNSAQAYGGSSSVGGFQMPNFSQMVSDQRNAMDARNAGYQGQEQAYLQRFRQAIQGQEALPAMAQRIGQELNLPQLQQNATNVNTMMANMPSTQRDLTRGFDVSNAQLNNLIAKRTSDLAPVVTSANNAANLAQQNLATQLGYGVQQQQKEMQPLLTEGNMMSDRIAREVTGYQQSMQNELSALLAQMQAGVQLSEGEKNRAQQLALAEMEYANQSKLIAQQQSYNQPQENRYLSGSSFYDTTTGKWITAPKQGSSGGSNIFSYLGGGSGGGSPWSL